MAGNVKSKGQKHGKDVFLTGEYIRYFTPEDRWNPFSKIYRQKKLDTLDIIGKLDGSEKILDVGGGMGRLSLALARAGRSKIILTDISKDMLKLVLKDAGNLTNIDVVNADAHNLPFSGGSFDIVVGLDLFCHLGRPEEALQEFNRVLAKQGTLILDSTNSNPLWALFYPRYLGKNPATWIKVMKFGGILPGWENIVRHYPKKKFLSLLHDVGFRVMRDINYGPVICPKWHLTVSKKAG